MNNRSSQSFIEEEGNAEAKRLTELTEDEYEKRNANSRLRMQLERAVCIRAVYGDKLSVMYAPQQIIYQVTVAPVVIIQWSSRLE